MPQFLLPFLIVFLLTAIPFKPLISQTSTEELVIIEEEDVLVEEDDEQKTTKSDLWKDTVDFWDRYMKLVVGSSFNYHNNGLTYYGFLGLSYNQTFFDWLTINIAGELYRTDRRLGVTLSVADQNTTTRYIGTYKFGRWVPTLRDSYAQFDIGEYLRLTVGRKTIIWGQFDVVSPVDLILPLRINLSDPATTKESGRLPQDTAILGVYIKNMELELFYFPRYNIDTETRSSLTRLAGELVNTSVRANTREELESAYNLLVTNTTSFGGEGPARIDGSGRDSSPTFEKFLAGEYVIQTENLFSKDQDVKPTTAYNFRDGFNDLANNFQLAARLMLYFDFMTIGFTYFNGFHSLGLIQTDKLLETRSLIPNRNYYHYERIRELPRTHLAGIEVAVPTGNWTWKSEIGMYPFTLGFGEIGLLNSAYSGFNSFTSISGKQPKTREARELVDIIQNQRNGIASYTTYLIIAGFGFTASFERWRMDFNLYYLPDFFTLTKLDKDIERLRGLVFATTDVPAENFSIPIPVVPAFNVAWYATQDKDITLGLLAGSLGGFSVGGSLYFIHNLFDDSLAYAVSGEITLPLTETFALPGGADLSGGFIQFGGRVSVKYTL